jgi:DNA-binding response OmpR family regulator
VDDSDVPVDGNGGPAKRAGYTLIVGAEGEDRDWVLKTLQWAGMEAAAHSEDEIHASDDWVPPALVIYDDVAGGEAKRESQKRLQKHPAFRGVPLLVLSFDADIDSYTGAITKGAAAYLIKPIPAEELVEAAQKLCDWKGSKDRTEKRRRLRRPILMKVTVDLRARKVRVPGQLVDASGTGCRIELGEEVSPGELVRVILHGHEDSTHVALGAEVRWHRVSPTGVHVAGLKFSGTTALLAGKLLGFATTGLT